VCPDSDIKRFSLFDRVAFPLLLAPFPSTKRIQHDLSLVEANGNMEWDIIASEVSAFTVQADGEPKRVVTWFFDESSNLFTGIYRFDSSMVAPFTVRV